MRRSSAGGEDAWRGGDRGAGVRKGLVSGETAGGVSLEFRPKRGDGGKQEV